MLQILSLGDWIAFALFIICWSGYTYFANRKMRGKVNITRSLTSLREFWIKQLLTRQTRIFDATLLGVLQRTVSFFASTTVFILAGLLTVLGASEKVIKLAHSLPFVAEHSQVAWEFKLLVMIFVFIYAFLKFSWSVRQYNFALVLFGAAPDEKAKGYEQFVEGANLLLTSANNSFNYGLRAFTFSMAIIAWFVHPWAFMFATCWVVAILYRREFRSNTLAAMKKVNQALSLD